MTMTRREIDRIAARLPVHKQVALELLEVRDEMRDLTHLLGRAVTEVAIAAASVFYSLSVYPRHMHR